MPRKKSAGPKKNFQFRLTPEEAKRWFELYEKAKMRTVGKLDDTYFNRLLVGLEHNPALVTEKDRLSFFSVSVEEPKLIGQAPSGKAHIKQVSPRSKQGT